MSVQKSISESGQIAEQTAPGVSGPAHTPTPWAAEPEAGKGAWIAGANGEWAALSCGNLHSTARANAAFIVRAVNSHDALVRALEAIAALDAPRTDLIGAVKRVRHIAKCALASAREVQP